MTQLILECENSTIRHRLLKVIELMDGVTIVKPQKKSRTKKSGLDEALEDVKAGRVSEYASVDDFFKEMGI